MRISQVLEGKQASIRRILANHDRLPGYVSLKVERVLPQLERAVQKVREGSYGRCDECLEQIPRKRLKAVPGATRCTPCQAFTEVQHHRGVARHV